MLSATSCRSQPIQHLLLPRAAWQGYANELANAETDEQLVQLVQGILAKEGVAPGGWWAHTERCSPIAPLQHVLCQ